MARFTDSCHFPGSVCISATSQVVASSLPVLMNVTLSRLSFIFLLCTVIGHVSSLKMQKSLCAVFFSFKFLEAGRDQKQVSLALQRLSKDNEHLCKGAEERLSAQIAPFDKSNLLLGVGR